MNEIYEKYLYPLKELRVKLTLVGDESSPWEEYLGVKADVFDGVPPVGVDVVIDTDPQIQVFNKLFPVVSENGIYFCESPSTDFIEHTKDFIDKMNAWYSEEEGFVTDEYSVSLGSVHYYKNLIVIEKEKWWKDRCIWKVTGTTEVQL